MDIKALKKEILAATGLKREPDEKEQVFLSRVVKAVTKLPDAKWDALSVEAQDWQNDNIDRLNDKAKPPIIGFGPDEADEAPEPPARRARTRAAEPEREPDEPELEIDDLLTGDTATIMVGKEEVVGEVVEVDEKNLVLLVDGEEEVFRRSKVKVLKAAGPADKRAPAAAEEPNIGDRVTLTLRDGELVQGVLVELDEKNVVLEIKGEEEVFRRSKVQDIKGVDAAPPAARRGGREAPPPAPATRSRRGAAAEAPAEPARRTRAAAGEDGESDVKKAWKLMSEHMDDTFEQAQKRVEKAGLKVKEGTLNIRYKDLQHAYERFVELGLIK